MFLKGIKGEGEGESGGHQRGIWLFGDVGCAEECGCHLGQCLIGIRLGVWFSWWRADCESNFGCGDLITLLINYT